MSCHGLSCMKVKGFESDSMRMNYTFFSQEHFIFEFSLSFEDVSTDNLSECLRQCSHRGFKRGLIILLGRADVSALSKQRLCSGYRDSQRCY